MEASRGSPRVKVLMAQKYNTPLGIYSAENVIESFAVHTETALESIERYSYYSHSSMVWNSGIRGIRGIRCWGLVVDT